MKKLTNEKFIENCIKIHGLKYDYSDTIYLNMRTKIKILCKDHGYFYQSAFAHTQGQGCKECGKIVVSNKLVKDTEEFILLANKQHNNLYNYSVSFYKGNKDKIDIICNLHGVFKQTPNHHLSGRGCPKCKNQISKPEIELQEFIKSLGFNIETNNRKILNRKELDIYIPELSKAIEFNGLYWHYHKDNFKVGKHGNKSKLCKEKGIKLLHIREDLWLKDKEKMKNVILKFLKQ